MGGEEVWEGYKNNPLNVVRNIRNNIEYYKEINNTV